MTRLRWFAGSVAAAASLASRDHPVQSVPGEARCQGGAGSERVRLLERELRDLNTTLLATVAAQAEELEYFRARQKVGRSIFQARGIPVRGQTLTLEAGVFAGANFQYKAKVREARLRRFGSLSARARLAFNLEHANPLTDEGASRSTPPVPARPDYWKQAAAAHEPPAATDGSAAFVLPDTVVRCNPLGAKLWRNSHLRRPLSAVKQQRRVTTMLRFAGAMDIAGVPFFLAMGTLLGFWRECDFLTHSSGIDVGVLHRHYTQAVVAHLGAAGFVMVRELGNADRELYKITFAYLDLDIDIFIFDERLAAESPDTTGSAARRSLVRPLWPPDRTMVRVCHARVQQFAVADWLNRSFYVPFPPDSFLEAEYGSGVKGWLQPSSGRRYCPPLADSDSSAARVPRAASADASVYRLLPLWDSAWGDADKAVMPTAAEARSIMRAPRTFSWPTEMLATVL